MSGHDACDPPPRPRDRTVAALVVDPDGSLAAETRTMLGRLGTFGPSPETSVEEVLAIVGRAEADVLLVARVADTTTSVALRGLLDRIRRLDPHATSAFVNLGEPASITDALAASLAAHRRARRRERRRSAHALTKRELEVLRLAAPGRSNREIAHLLWLSPETVKFHLANTYRKLGVAGRADAARAATARGLLPSSSYEIESCVGPRLLDLGTSGSRPDAFASPGCRPRLGVTVRRTVR